MVVLNIDAKVPALQTIQKMASGPRPISNSNMYSKFNHQPKMTSGSKTIMSPLTTMSKKMLPPQTNVVKTNIVPTVKTNILPALQPQIRLTVPDKANKIQPVSKNVMTENNCNVQLSQAPSVKEIPKVDSAIKVDNVKSTLDAEPLKSNDSNNNSDKAAGKIQDIEPVVAVRSKFVDNYKPAKVSLVDCNVYITCKICKGYLIEATTIVECLHTFCHSCLMKHLQNHSYCPICEMVINQSKTNIKYDATTQMIVYKLVPGLYEKELLRKRAFYKSRPQDALMASPEQRGDDTEHLIFSPSDNISLSLDFAEKETLTAQSEENQFQNLMKTKYLQCPAGFKVEHLKRFVMNKFLINSRSFNVEISYKVKTIVLPDHYTLMDVAYIYTWKREAPMGFYFRIIAKDSKLNELPEVQLRRSPTIVTLPVIQEESGSAPPKRKSVTFKDFADTPESKKGEGLKMKISADIGKDGEKSPTNFKIIQNEPKIETIKLKVDATNKNVSIVKPVSPSTIKTDKQEKSEQKIKKRLEKLEKKNRMEQYYQSHSKPGPKKSKIDKSSPSYMNPKPSQFKVPEATEVMPRKERDEYDFEDEIDEQKLGFLSSFELASKNLVASAPVPDMLKLKPFSALSKTPIAATATLASQSTSVASSPSVSSTQSQLSQIAKRKSKDQIKATPKKFKYHMVTNDEAFQKKKMREGKEITFDLSPKPLGTKPAPSKVNMEMLQEMNKKAAEQAEKQAEKLSTAQPVTPKKEPSQSQSMRPPASIPIKPKKLPMLLPKGMEQIGQTNNSPNSFMIRKQEMKKPPSEISVTRINDGKNVKVYGPKPQAKSQTPSTPPQMPALAPTSANNDGFLFPYPPKQKSNPNSPVTSPQQPTFHQMQAIQAQQHLQQMQLQQQMQQFANIGFGRPKVPKILPLNTRTFGSRTPFYTPNSPVYSPNSPAYTPNYAQPNFKYTNPTGQYLNFMGNGYKSNNGSPPLSSANENPRKRQKESTDDSSQAKRKTPSPPKPDSDPKVLNILNQISFPSSLSVTLTNEQEETKKEQVRYSKNNPVNNNIEIIKLPDAEKGMKSPSPPTLAPTATQNTQSKEFKVPDPKRPIAPSVAAALKAAEAKETFQLKFLESIVHQQNKQALAQKAVAKHYKPDLITEESKPVSPPAVVVQKSSKSPKHHNPKLEKCFVIPTMNELLAQQQRRKSLSPSSMAGDQMTRTNALDLSGPPQPRKSQTPPAKLAPYTPREITQNQDNPTNPAAMQLNRMLSALGAVAAKNYGAMPNFNNLIMLDQLRQNMEQSNALLIKRHNDFAKEQLQKK